MNVIVLAIISFIVAIPLSILFVRCMAKLLLPKKKYNLYTNTNKKVI